MPESAASAIFGERFYSVQELADALGYHPDSIYRAIQRGEIVASKPRGKWLIAGPAVNGWLQAGQVTAPASPSRRPASAGSEKSTGRARAGARPSFRELARRARAT